MRIDNSVSGVAACQTIEQFHEACFVRIAHGRFAIWLDPFRVLNPKVGVDLLPELRVGVDLMMQGCWLGERFMRGAGWFAWLALSVNALRSKANKFHKALPPRGLIYTPTRKPFVRYYAHARHSGWPSRVRRNLENLSGCDGCE